MQNELINTCYQKAIELLLQNSTKFGTLASAPQKRAVNRNYLSVFARDASICSLGMIASKNKRLIRIAKKNIKTLAKYQADNGQIPNYVKPEIDYVDFWRIGSIDATLWWLIALDFYHRNTKDKKLKKSLDKKVKLAFSWLNCQKHPQDELLIQNEASDWADIFPRSGKVLYSNALWLKVKEAYNLKNYNLSKNSFNNLFYPFNNKTKKIAQCEKTTVKEILKNKKQSKFLLSYTNYLFWGEDIDVYGNSLAIIFKNISKPLSKKIINNLLNQKTRKNFPMPVLFNPIKKNSKLWRKYMESHDQNLPNQYHNGGIWPYASSFFAIALYSAEKKKEATLELEKIAYINSLKNWEFNEWFHAKNGKAMGMKKQSWNAGAFLLAYHCLRGDVKI
jgi:glycogen debranching enzyme